MQLKIFLNTVLFRANFLEGFFNHDQFYYANIGF